MKINKRKFVEIFSVGEIADLANSILDRACEDDRNDIAACDKIIDALNDLLIYYDDLWAVMKNYQTPEDASLQNALDDFLNDLLSVVED